MSHKFSDSEQHSDRRRNRDRDEQGRFVSTSGPEEVFTMMKVGEPYTTRELADLVSISRRGTLNYLNKLAEQRRIRRKKPEPHRLIWIRPE